MRPHPTPRLQNAIPPAHGERQNEQRAALGHAVETIKIPPRGNVGESIADVSTGERQVEFPARTRLSAPRGLQPLRGVEYRETRRRLDRHFGDRFGMLAIRWRAPTSPSSVINSLKNGATTARGCPPSVADGHRDQLATAGAKVSISGRSIAPISAACRPGKSARRRHSRHRRNARFTELASPPAKSGLRTNFTFRPARACSISSA